jgi:hypothetical protein
MLRILFSLIIIIHGLIHLLGFVKEFNLASVDQLTGKTLFTFSGSTAKVIGFLWLVACAQFLTSSIIYLLKKDWWRIVASLSFILSQSLIILYWQDAKYGTIANIILLLVIIPSYGTWNFNQMVKHELEDFLKFTDKKEQIITSRQFINFPPVVQKWLIRSGITGKISSGYVYLMQKGKMRTSPDGKWMNAEAEQYFDTYDPGFIWIADVSMNPVLKLKGRDKYERGHGHMLIKLMSLFPVVDSRGAETDQGTMLRYLGEAVWFPQFALSPWLKWEPLDSTRAKVTMNYKGVSASGIFTFSKEGDFVSFSAERYYDRKDGATLEDWLVTADPQGYKVFEGIRVPAKLSVTWQLKTGDFTWYNLEVEKIRYIIKPHLIAFEGIQ